jgi:hypothetical protein
MKRALNRKIFTLEPSQLNAYGVQVKQPRRPPKELEVTRFENITPPPLNSTSLRWMFGF